MGKYECQAKRNPAVEIKRNPHLSVQLESSHATQVSLFAPLLSPATPDGGPGDGFAPLRLGRGLHQDHPIETSSPYYCLLGPQVDVASFATMHVPDDFQNFRSIMNIDEAAGLMDLDLTLTLYWRDTGVSINGTTKKRITINPEQDDILKKIWFPDIAIDQATSFTTSFRDFEFPQIRQRV